MIFTRELENAVMSKENEEDRRRREEAYKTVENILYQKPEGRRAAILATREKHNARLR